MYPHGSISSPWRDGIAAQLYLFNSPWQKLSFRSTQTTFNSAKEIQETIQNIPLENILIETDSPYLTPVPYRWKEENEPMYVKYIFDKVCELRDEDDEIIKNTLYQNSKRVFNI